MMGMCISRRKRAPASSDKREQGAAKFTLVARATPGSASETARASPGRPGQGSGRSPKIASRVGGNYLRERKGRKWLVPVGLMAIE
jgi:hypothetical protein